jgi:hypothetical protein
VNRDEALDAARLNARRARESGDAVRSAEYSRRKARIEAFRQEVADFIAREAAAGYPTLAVVDTSHWVQETVRVGLLRKGIRDRHVQQEEPAWAVPTGEDAPGGAAARDEAAGDESRTRLYLLPDGQFWASRDGVFEARTIESLEPIFEEISRLFHQT